MTVRAVILIGGRHKCTRLNAVTTYVPTPLFNVAGCPIVEHQIRKLCEVNELDKIFLIGTQSMGDKEIENFCSYATEFYRIAVEYLQEDKAKINGTGGCLLQFKNKILESTNKSVENIIVLNHNVVFNYNFPDFLHFYKEKSCQTVEKKHCIAVKKFPCELTKYFGSVILNDADPCKVEYYTEKYSNCVANHINCGVIILDVSIFDYLESKELVFQKFPNMDVKLFDDILPNLSFASNLLAYNIGDIDFTRIKHGGSMLFANKFYTQMYYGDSNDVFVSEDTKIGETAKIGPNVSIGKNCVIESGVRIKNAIISQNCVIKCNSLVSNSIIGMNCKIGAWSRIEGCNLNSVFDEFQKFNKESLFDSVGKLSEGPTVIGDNVTISDGVMIHNCVIMPYLKAEESYENEIIL